MLRVEHSSRSALTFAMQMLDARADKLALVRCKGNSQLGLGQMEEKNSDKRLLESFQVTICCDAQSFIVDVAASRRHTNCLAPAHPP